MPESSTPATPTVNAQRSATSAASSSIVPHARPACPRRRSRCGRTPARPGAAGATTAARSRPGRCAAARRAAAARARPRDRCSPSARRGSGSDGSLHRARRPARGAGACRASNVPTSRSASAVEADVVEQPVDALVGLLARQPVERRRCSAGSGGRSGRRRSRRRRAGSRPATSPRSGSRVGFMPVDRAAAGRRLGEPEQHQDRRRLAGAVRAEQTEHLAARPSRSSASTATLSP